MPVVTAAYPQALASFSEKFDLVDVVFADHINALQREVAAIQATLGTLPAGLAVTTVRDRLEAIETSLAEIAAHFDAGGAFPQTAVTGLSESLAGLSAGISDLETSLTALGSQVSALGSQKPETAQVVLLSGQQSIYGLKLFQGLVRLLATQRYSGSSTNHAWEIGVSGGRVIKFDYMGWGAYDGTGPADMELQREGGHVFFGGDIRVAGLAGVSAENAAQKTTNSDSYVGLTATPALTVKVPSSGRVAILLANEASVPNGEARMAVQLSGANTLAPVDRWSTLVSTATFQSAARHIYLTGLTPGSTTFSTRFLSTLGSLAAFRNMSLTVIPMP